MKSFSHKYKNNTLLKEFAHPHSSKSDCIVQVFSGKENEEFLEDLCSVLSVLLPQAHVVGSTTDIGNTKISPKETVVSISYSDDEKLPSSSVENKDSYINAREKVKELGKSTRFFQKIFETANEGIWVTNMEKETIMVNDALCEMLGYAEDEIIGKSMSYFIDAENQKIFKKKTTKIQSGKSDKNYEMKLIHKDARPVYALFSTEVLSNEKDEIIGSFAMVTDITKRKQAEEELVSFNYLLEDKIAEEVLKNHSKDELMTKQMRMAQMGEMISMIAHQWRQPLSTISAIVASMQLSLSLEDKEETEIYSDLDKVSEHIQFLSETIDDFRHFFSPNKSKSKVKICDLIDNSLGIVKQSLIQADVEVVNDYKHMTRQMELYSSELVQVFLNLIKNAMDVLVEKDLERAYISIRGSEYEDKSVIVFEDNGGGIPSEIIDKIFEPYFTTKDAKNGTGLGLYMSKMIIEEHCDGNLIVENSDVGARFTIALKY